MFGNCFHKQKYYLHEVRFYPCDIKYNQTLQNSKIQNSNSCDKLPCWWPYWISTITRNHNNGCQGSTVKDRLATKTNKHYLMSFQELKYNTFQMPEFKVKFENVHFSAFNHINTIRCFCPIDVWEQYFSKSYLTAKHTNVINKGLRMYCWQDSD